MSELLDLAPGPNGGLTVPVEAYKLACLLILDRNLVLSQEGEKLRIVRADGGKPDLSPEEADRIRRWKWHLLSLLAYRAPERTL